MSEDPTIFAALFNFSFTKLAAKQIVKTGYALFVACVATVTLGVMAITIKNVMDRIALGPEDLWPAFVAPFGALLALIVGRLFFELVIVLFNILDELRAQRQRWGG